MYTVHEKNMLASPKKMCAAPKVGLPSSTRETEEKRDGEREIKRERDGERGVMCD